MGTQYRMIFKAAILLLVCSLSLSGCGPKKVAQKPVVLEQKPAPSVEQLEPEPEHLSAALMAEVQACMQGEQLDVCMADLQQLIEQDPSPALQAEAAHRMAQIALSQDLPTAEQSLQNAHLYKTEPVVAIDTSLALAAWSLRHENVDEVYRLSAQILADEDASASQLSEAARLGQAVLSAQAEAHRVLWLLKAARALPHEREAYVQQAAAWVHQEQLEVFFQQHLADDFLDFYQAVARQRLLFGDMDGLLQLADWLMQIDAASPQAATVKGWALGELKTVKLGVLLPLHGVYRPYAEQALHGIRLALQDERTQAAVSLLIEDSGDQPEDCVAAYQRLQDAGVRMILGPLRRSCAEAIDQDVHAHTPILSTSSWLSQNPKCPLYTHSLTNSVQAWLLAEQMYQQGLQDVVVVDVAGSRSSMLEANAFAEAFQRLGGEVVHRMSLQPQQIDQRQGLRRLRERTDQQLMLWSLDQEADLFIAATKIEARLPVNFDAMYLAVPGKLLTLLAGQLRYEGISSVALYGSSRWDDGHLLDDHGRYLSQARFVHLRFPDARVFKQRRFMLDEREIWGRVKTTVLTGLHYDNTLIAVMLSSRLGFSGTKLEAVLKDPNGFSGLLGSVVFQPQGWGRVSLPMAILKSGRVVVSRQ